MYKTVFDHITNELRLGLPIEEPERVYGGFMHKMYRLVTETGTYAVKMLDPAVMKRPDAADNYRRAEGLEDILAESGIPVVRAMTLHGQKMQCAGGQYFYVFHWVDGKAVRWGEITAEHCAEAGTLLGKIHSIERHDRAPSIDEVHVDWDSHIKRAQAASPRVAEALRRSRELLYRAAEEYNDAVRRLPQVVTICNGDMDCKNVLWVGGEPVIIDLESLDYGSPFAEAWQLALSWAGGVMCDIGMEKLRAFLDAYSRECGFDIDILALYGMGFSWLDWLDYNVRRALGDAGDDPEMIALGENESIATVDRVAYYASRKDELLKLTLNKNNK